MQEQYKLKVANSDNTDLLSKYRTKTHDNWSVLEDFGLFLWPY